MAQMILQGNKKVLLGILEDSVNLSHIQDVKIKDMLKYSSDNSLYFIPVLSITDKNIKSRLNKN